MSNKSFYPDGIQDIYEELKSQDEDDTILHVYARDERHEMEEDCWCSPRVDSLKNGAKIVMHGRVN